MAFRKITDDLNIIQKLSDEPNDVGGLTASQLKAKFDEAGNKIKTAFNNLVDELNTSGTGASSASEISFRATTGVPEDNVQDAIVNVQGQIAEISQGSVADGSITKAKLANDTKKFVGWDNLTTGFAVAAGNNVETVEHCDAYYCESLRMVRLSLTFTTSGSTTKFSLTFDDENVYKPFEFNHSLIGVLSAAHGSDALLANIYYNEDEEAEIHVTSLSQIASGETIEVSGFFQVIENSLGES